MGGASAHFYVTSVYGECGLLFTLDGWEAVEKKLARMSSYLPAKQKFLTWTNYYGQVSRFNEEGLQLPVTLRKAAGLRQETILLGVNDRLKIYSLQDLNKLVCLGKVERQDMEILAEIDPNSDARNSILAAIDLTQRQDLLEALSKCRRETALYIARHPDAVFEVRPRVFEVIIAEVMRSFGFEVELTAQTRDGGVDIIAVYKDSLGIRTRYVVECKKWDSKRKVSIELVRAFYGAKEIHQADQAVYVTTASFTQDAWNLCETGQLRNLTLVTFERLQEWFREYLKSQSHQATKELDSAHHDSSHLGEET
jgi:restriction system protein